MVLAQQVFPLIIKLTERNELVLMGFVLKVVGGRFWWASGSSVVFKERSISLEVQALFFLASQIQKEHSSEHLLSCFIVLLMVQNPRPDSS